MLGHEIAHNTASHAAERLSAAWVGNLTAGSVFFLAGALPGLALFGLWSFVGGFYLQDLLFYLPMGRKQESEADYIGLMMMAEACYDPRAAVGFWQRMETIQNAGGQEVPEMLSTHPSVSLQHRQPNPSRQGTDTGPERAQDFNDQRVAAGSDAETHRERLQGHGGVCGQIQAGVAQEKDGGGCCLR